MMSVQVSSTWSLLRATFLRARATDRVARFRELTRIGLPASW